MFRRAWIARLFTVAAAVAISAGSAHAGLLPVAVTVQPDNGNFRWTYSVVLPSDMQLQAGNYFTIYDFAGYIENSATVNGAQPDGSIWTVTTSNIGPTPDMLNPIDQSDIENLTFTYHGPTVPAGQVTLGSFIALSEFGIPEGGFFTATNPRASDGQIDSNITTTLVPQRGERVPGPLITPEPTSLALAGLGLPLVGLARFLRRKNKGTPAAA